MTLTLQFTTPRGIGTHTAPTQAGNIRRKVSTDVETLSVIRLCAEIGAVAWTAFISWILERVAVQKYNLTVYILEKKISGTWSDLHF